MTTPPNPSAMSRRGARGLRAVPAESVLVFTRYEPPETTPATNPAPRRSAPRAPRAPRRKVSFVQSNARFALRPDAAAEFRWEDVECVFVEREQQEDAVSGAAAAECPICLQGLTAPKITPCGHVFDHVCLLQHVAHSADDPCSASIDDPNVPVKCPLCSTFFTLGELKHVAFRHVAPLHVGAVYRMQLVGIAHDVVQPYTGDEAVYETPTNVAEIDALFARFCVASKPFLCDLLVKCASELRATLAEDPSLKRFVDVAAKQVKSAKQAVHRAHKSDTVLKHGESDTAKGTNSSNGGEARLFYQAADARNVFLHPINYRCLAHEYGADMRGAPLTLQGRLLEVERHTMDDTIRKRFRFLRHLPDGCEFAMVELDLAGAVSADTLDSFRRELEARRAIRARKKAVDRAEDESAGKQRDEALQAYFRIDRAAARPIAPAHDEATFPTLASTPPTGGADSVPVPVDSAAAIGPTSRVASNAAQWGPAVSSYSSVTTNMGVFPALGEGAVGVPATGSSPRGAWAASPPGHSPPRGSHSHTPRRSGRTRYTTVLSNAGATHRRK